MKFIGQIRERLQADTGFSAQFLQDAMLHLAIQKRCEILSFNNPESYWKHLQLAETEWSSLIEEVVVNETWFLRDEKPFQYLADHAKREWLAHSEKRSILSAPCASGEEAYSIAITLLEAGLTPGRFAIDGLDISERALQMARRRTYRATAFRGGTLGDSPYFERSPEGDYRLRNSFDECVKFRKANLLDPMSFPEGGKFDVIFCRNLLIYLDDKARFQLLEILTGLLQAGGLLFVGHADAGAVVGSRLQPCGPTGAFAFSVRAHASKPAAFAPRGPLRPIAIRKPEPIPVKTLPGARSTESGRSVAEKVSEEITLERATVLADAGKTKEANALCEDYLKTHPLCLRGTHLLAVLRLAVGDRDQAERLFNKVVYLDPRHMEALLHLKRLAELRGDRASVESWRRRIENNQAAIRP
ncbi:MAG: methylase of chemotaxis methyl-accepting protein [Verrucomicrobiales bacterium]|nr:methylase of chemotaxis methyl-accepting protein [Verrucomicrobiales bacterium]